MAYVRSAIIAIFNWSCLQTQFFINITIHCLQKQCRLHEQVTGELNLLLIATVPSNWLIIACCWASQNYEQVLEVKQCTDGLANDDALISLAIVYCCAIVMIVSIACLIFALSWVRSAWNLLCCTGVILYSSLFVSQHTSTSSDWCVVCLVGERFTIGFVHWFILFLCLNNYNVEDLKPINLLIMFFF